MTQQQTPTQLAQTFPRKTEDLTTASILTASNTPMLNLGPSSSVPVQSTTSATIPSTSGGGAAANITDKNDPKMVEQSVAKLKQFLKKLVKLAEGRKKEVQDQVQSHVQRLLAGALSEEQFAENLEKDLNSPHQPNLLPFLKCSVPHLRATLLQQRLMIDKQQQLLEKQKIAALLMTQQAQTFPVKTEGLNKTSILTTSNVPVNLPTLGPSSSVPVQSTTSATIPSTSGAAANITDKNDSKMVEQSVAKLKKFLKNLVKLAEGRKKEVQDRVQSHVQRLLAGALSEEQFAENLEKDLNSPHQPNLLPFLKCSVPYLRATLLQQRLMIGKQQQLLEKQKIAALLMTQASAAGLNSTKPAIQAATVVATAAAMSSTAAAMSSTALTTTTPAATASTTTLLATPNTSTNTLQAPNWTVQNLKFLQNMTPEKQQRLLQQRQVLQQYLEMQQAQLKKEALEAVNSINATSEPDIQITGVSRQQAKNKQRSTASSGKFLDSKFKAKPLTRGKTKKDFSTFGDGHSDDEEEDMEVAGVNLQEEAVHFLPPSAIEADTSDKKIEDVLILDKELLRHKILAKGRLHDVISTTDDTISLVSHATEERLKNILSKLAVISQHRTDILKDDAHYELKSQPRDQLKLLESINRGHTKRKQEQEREKLLKAAKSKSKSDDPNLIRIKEQAKQLQMEEEEQIRKRAANETALSAIGTRRKRPAPNSQEAQLLSATGSSLGVLTGSQPKHKRRVGLRDLVFMMEQESCDTNNFLMASLSGWC